MWETLDQAAAALTRDGWKRCTAYWWDKAVSGGCITVELEWDRERRYLFPVMHDDREV